MKLWEINETIEKILLLPDGNGVDVETGEVFSTDAIDALNIQRDEKIEACLLFAKNQQAEAEMIGKEVAKLNARKKVCENRADRILKYVQFNLKGEPFETSKAAVRYNTSSKCIVYCKPEDLPKQFQKVTITAMKDDLTKYINAGNSVDGVAIEKNKTITVK